MKRINLLREVSLFKFYKTGVKSIYSYACQNVIMLLFSTLDLPICITIAWLWESTKKRTICRAWRRALKSMQTSKSSLTISMSAITASISILPTFSLHANLYQIGRACPKLQNYNQICIWIQVIYGLFRFTKGKAFAAFCCETSKLFQWLCKDKLRVCMREKVL